MKSLHIIMFFLLWTLGILHAQEVKLFDSTRNKIDSTLVLKTNELDSIKKIKNKVLDSIDYINHKASQQISNLNEAVSNPTNALDTLTLPLDKYSKKLETARNKLTTKIDSLNNLGLPHDTYSKALDSLNKINPLNQLQKVENKLSKTQSKVNDKLNQPASKVNEKLNLLKNEAGGEGDLPGNITMPGIDQKELSGIIPDTGLNSSGISLQDSKLDNVSTDINTNINLNPKDKLNDLGSLEEVGKVQDGLAEAGQVTEKISGYSEDVKNISSGNLEEVKQIDKDLVSKLSNDQLQAAKGQLDAGSQQIEMVKSFANREEFKKQTLAKAREIVTMQLASQQSKITETVNKVSQHQKRAGSIFNKVKGLPKRPLKEKKPPIIERFVPGITLQVQKTDNWFVDFNPTLRYRVRSIFSAGAGWNERIVFDKDFNFYKENRIYGVRSFYELSVRKGFWLRADVERMNAFVPLSRTQQDIGERKYVWSYMAGIKKEFSFAPGVAGNVQFMYNLHDPERTSPYFNRFNVRFGFEFPLKKKLQKKS